MKNILEVWRYNNFIQPLLEIVLIVTLVISIRKRNKIEGLKLIPVYLVSFILLMFNTYAYYLFFKDTKYSSLFASLDRYGNYVVSLIEFLTFCFYFYSLAETLKIRRIIKIASCICLIFFAIVLLVVIASTKKNGMIILNYLFLTETIALVLISTAYLIESSQSDEPRSFKRRNVWIPASLLFSLGLSLVPTFMIILFFRQDIVVYKKLFTVIYLSYIILFLTIIRSYISNKS